MTTEKAMRFTGEPGVIRHFGAGWAFDMIELQIEHDKRRYKEMSVRAKLRQLGRPTIGFTRYYYGVERMYTSGPRLRTERKYVRRAVPTAWTLAARREMDHLMDAMRYSAYEPKPKRLPWWRRWYNRVESWR